MCVTSRPPVRFPVGIRVSNGADQAGEGEGSVMSISDEQLLAVTPERAAKIAGISLRQVGYWRTTGLVRPSVERVITPRNVVRLYSFQDLVELYAVAQMKRQNVTLQHVRAVVTFLRDEGVDHPLREIVFATHGRRIYFQRPDGSWFGADQPHQGVIRQVLPLEEIRQAVRSAAHPERDRAAVGQIERRRRVHTSKPVLAGTRVPMDAVAAFIREGYDDERILRAYPQLEAADIEAVRSELAAASL